MGTPINLTLKQKLPDGAWEDLQDRYSEPHRHYHTWDHIENMLDMFEEIESNLRMPWAVEVAILYHDAVYDPPALNNEEQSAKLAGRVFDGKVTEGLQKIIQQLIQRTKTHTLYDTEKSVDTDVLEFIESLENPEQQLKFYKYCRDMDSILGNTSDYEYFLDMDLASLGASEEQFDINGDNIRKEYAHLTDEEYNAGRLAFFNSFLARDRIYFTDYFYDKYEVKARDNLTRSKQALEEKI